MSRLTKKQLEDIKQKYNTDRIWSYSRINTFMTSPWEYMLKYIQHKKEDRQDSIYVTTGTIAHDILDAFYEGEIEYNGMIDKFNDGWLTAYDIARLKFDRSDEERNKSIAEKYKENLIHFFNNHTVYKHKLLIEKPITINVNDNIFIGYIDALYKDDDECINIIDFKTSSIYKNKTLEEHSQQLMLYALGIHQSTGTPLNKIKCCFNFLKYITIEYQQANGKVKTRDVERYKLGESLQSNLKVWIKKLGYEDQMDEFLKMALEDNGLERLPKDIQEKYKFMDCHVYIDISEEKINKLIDEISATIKDIKLREADYNETHNDKVFWDTEESVKKQSYYFANLCSYSGNLHKPYAEFLSKLETAKSGGDLFAGINNDLNATSTSNVIDSSDNSLDWLNSI